MKIVLLLICSLVFNLAFTQKRTTFKFEKSATINLSAITEDWKTKVQNMEAPSPDGKSYKSYLAKRKIEIEKEYSQLKSFNNANTLSFEADTPIVLKSFEGNTFGGGVPNDNTLAVSNDNIVLSSINSNIFIYDGNVDTLINSVSLEAFGDALGLTAHKYDPKAKYDPDLDRFILTYLCGTTDTETNIIIAFSQTNDPNGDWNLYALPGNPYGNNYWSDYPALGLTKDDFFITINLIETGVSWQEGFRGTLVWQMDKSTGFDGEDLTSVMWSEVEFEGGLIRNMHPISGGSEWQDNMYFLSNRNFSESNDTIFVVELIGDANNASATMEVKFATSDVMYGLPPDARQLGFHRLATNDARVLGGFVENNEIEFVANSINPENGNPSVYHGFITDYDQSSPQASGRILSDSTDWGYPNIAYTGKSSGDKESIINFNFTHPDIRSSCALMFYDGNEDEYSPKTVTATGDTWVDIISGVDRWGDYSGMQRKFNEPGTVWCTGTFGTYVPYGGSSYKGNQTLITMVASPDSTEVLEPVDEFSFKIGPNPSSDLVSIFFELPTDQRTSIVIHDVQGKLVKTLINDKMKQGNNMLSFSSYPLAEGVYIISILGEEGFQQSERLIKN